MISHHNHSDTTHVAAGYNHLKIKDTQGRERCKLFYLNYFMLTFIDVLINHLRVLKMCLLYRPTSCDKNICIIEAGLA